MFEVVNGKLIASIYNSLDDEHPEKELVVPDRLASALDEFLETISPDYHYIPVHYAPDCIRKVVDKKTPRDDEDHC